MSSARRNDDGPTVRPVGHLENTQNENPDCHAHQHAAQALRVIQGEQQARDYLARLQAKQADPDELAIILSMLYGAGLRGFCRVLAKALGVHHA